MQLPRRADGQDAGEDGARGVAELDAQHLPHAVHMPPWLHGIKSWRLSVKAITLVPLLWLLL